MRKINCLSTVILILLYQTYLAQKHTPLVSEADVMWSTRLEREIDLKQKTNHHLFYPLEPRDGYSSLYDSIIEAIISEDLNAYGVGSLGRAELSAALSLSEFESIISRTDSVWEMDLETGELILILQQDSLISKDILRYRLIEERLFDRSKSQIINRILFIAPLKEVRSEEGFIRGFKPLFYIYFPHAREVLSNSPVGLRQTEKRLITYDDVFIKRLFQSYIVKSSNVFSRPINSHKSGVDVLLESEEENLRLLNYELDLWEY